MAIVVVAAAGYLWGMLATKLDCPSVRLRLRLLSVVGLAVTLALICLGGVWPSLFTIIAIPAIPAPILFSVGLLNPMFIGRKPNLRLYLNLCVLASGLAWAVEMSWLHHFK